MSSTYLVLHCYLVAIHHCYLYHHFWCPIYKKTLSISLMATLLIIPSDPFIVPEMIKFYQFWNRQSSINSNQKRLLIVKLHFNIIGKNGRALWRPHKSVLPDLSLFLYLIKWWLQLTSPHCSDIPTYFIGIGSPYLTRVMDNQQGHSWDLLCEALWWLTVCIN